MAQREDFWKATTQRDREGKLINCGGIIKVTTRLEACRVRANDNDCYEADEAIVALVFLAQNKVYGKPQKL